MTEQEFSRDDIRHWHLDKRLNLSHIITTLAQAAPVAAFSILEAQCKTNAPLSSSVP